MVNIFTTDERFWSHSHMRLPSSGKPKNEEKMFDKTQLMTTIDAIVTQRLFGDGAWLVNFETCIALIRTLETLGLSEQLPDGDSRCTKLGKEINADLQEVFMGLYDPFDALEILHCCKLVSDEEFEELIDLLEMKEEEEYEPLLRARVQQAYRDYYNSRVLH